MCFNKQYSSWVEINLGAIQNNIHYIHNRSNVQIMAVVKANAYGHGMVPVTRAAIKGGATWCGVARLEEALDFRQAGIECPLLLLGYTPPDRYVDAITKLVSITVWSQEQIDIAEQVSMQTGIKARVHLKVDTGMSRLGAQVEDAILLARNLNAQKFISFEGVFTHFARADESDPNPTDQQEHLFYQVIEALQAEGLCPPVIHSANSAASLTRPTAYFNLLRMGIAMYGLHPSSQCPLPPVFQPALTWKSVLSQVKILPAGRGVSYEHIYTTHKDERIGTIPVGYADGFRRTPGNIILIQGRRVPVVGRVCMDQIMVSLDTLPEAKTGEEVVLIGSQGEQTISAEEVARRWDTINYEVTCGIGARVPRIFLS